MYSMELYFLREQNLPNLGSGNHSAGTKLLHEWCGKISQFMLSLSERVLKLEKKETESLTEIIQIKSDLDNAVKIRAVTTCKKASVDRTTNHTNRLPTVPVRVRSGLFKNYIKISNINKINWPTQSTN